MEVTFEMNAWQPDSELIKHHAIRQTDRSEKLCLRKFEEVNIRAVENDTRGVDITPTNALFNRELFETHKPIHRFSQITQISDFGMRISDFMLMSCSSEYETVFICTCKKEHSQKPQNPNPHSEIVICVICGNRWICLPAQEIFQRAIELLWLFNIRNMAGILDHN